MGRNSLMLVAWPASAGNTDRGNRSAVVNTLRKANHTGSRVKMVAERTETGVIPTLSTPCIASTRPVD